MKIVYLHQYFNTPEMTGGTRSFEMASRLVKAGHEVHVITTWREETARDEWYVTDEAGIHVHWLPLAYSNYLSYFERIKVFFRFAFRATQRACALDADVVFATSTPLTIAIPGVLAAKKRKVPLVFEVRDLWPEMPIAMGAIRSPLAKFAARKLEHWAYSNSAVVVALSPGMKEGVVRTGYPAERVAVIPNGCDIDYFDLAADDEGKYAWNDGRPVLLYAGTFGRVNSVGYMVRLAQESLSIGSNVSFVLVGDGAEKDKVLSLAESSGVLNVNLFFESSVRKKDIPSLMSKASMCSNLVVDIPEARANSANKFFDSLAAGRPIFINHGGWMHELVSKYGCGYSSWGVPVSQAAKDLYDRMNDESWMRTAKLMSRKLAEESFDRDQLAANLCSILEMAAEGSYDQAYKIAPGNF